MPSLNYTLHRNVYYVMIILCRRWYSVGGCLCELSLMSVVSLPSHSTLTTCRYIIRDTMLVYSILFSRAFLTAYVYKHGVSIYQRLAVYKYMGRESYETQYLMMVINTKENPVSSSYIWKGRNI